MRSHTVSLLQGRIEAVWRNSFNQIPALSRQIWVSVPHPHPRRIQSENEAPVKRPRGRPRKEISSDEASSTTLTSDRKNKTLSSSNTSGANKRKSSKDKPSQDDKGKGRAKASKLQEGSDSPSTHTSAAALSSVAKGTAFELIALHVLRVAFNMQDLERSGGSGDRGVDLTGWWWYPSQPISQQAKPAPESGSPAQSGTGTQRSRIRVMVQCKYQAPSKGSLGPVHVRELEGTLYRKAFEARLVRGMDDKDLVQVRPDIASVTSSIGGVDPDHTPSSIYRVPLLGVLTSSTGFSSACARYAQASPFPLLLLHIQPDPETFQSVNSEISTGSSDVSKKKTVPLPIFAALPNLALLSSAGILDGRLELRATRRLRQRKKAGEGGEDEERTEQLVPGSIDSPLVLFDGEPLSKQARPR
ncbi:hypothetical protein OC846_006085 [Tilletia horrida]|uniref:Required for respiratory growth protein 7, mitochondrial n=1 Tax=Tilletia horrida TaxID=155126 RepID=A0AAN6JPB2_9BASI|nr:hypothetical protein OC846_006085 [Tilletia horrida]KAK0547325.1 hypothetical protein OC845_004146 [Tilletia horrida]KAK0564598.1 hypothetical protein OC861_004188 [Tilletia horrida]